MASMTGVLNRDGRMTAKCDSVRLGTATCRCGQDLDLYGHSYCPRCGTCRTSR